MKKQILKKYFSKKMLFIILGIFIGIGITAQIIIINQNIVPEHCLEINNLGSNSDTCGYTFTKGSINPERNPLDTFILKTQDGNFFKVTNHSGELVGVPEDYIHDHDEGVVDHSHSDPTGTWTLINESEHSHTGELNPNPSAGFHETVVANGFTTNPRRGYHQMDTGTYQGKWTGIDMAINGIPDFHIYETEPKKIFIPNADTRQIARFINATKKVGDYIYDEETLNTGTTIAVTDGPFVYDEASSQLGGVEVCRVDPLYPDECIIDFICGEPLIDETGTNPPQSYETVKIGDKCWFKDDLTRSLLTPAQVTEFENATTLLYEIENGTTLYPTSNNSLPDQAYPELWQMCQDISGGTADVIASSGLFEGGSQNPTHVSYALRCEDYDLGNIHSESYVHGTTFNTSNPLVPSSPGAFYYSNQIKDYTCPPGWHIPTDDEWKEMELVLGVNNSVIDTHNHSNGNMNNRTVATDATPLITTMGWDTGEAHTYFTRSIVSQNSVISHIIREIYPHNTSLTSFQRKFISGDDISKKVSQHLPLPAPIQWIMAFIPEVKALAVPPFKAKIRCVKGPGITHWAPSPWTPWSQCSTDPEPSQSRSRTFSCQIGEPGVPESHSPLDDIYCLNSSSPIKPFVSESRDCTQVQSDGE